MPGAPLGKWAPVRFQVGGEVGRGRGSGSKTDGCGNGSVQQVQRRTDNELPGERGHRHAVPGDRELG